MRSKHLSTLITAALLLGACSTGAQTGGGGMPANPSAPSPAASSATSVTGESSQAPLSVVGAHGPLTLKQRPKKILTLHDHFALMLHSLGFTNVIAAGSEEKARPWAKGKVTFDPNLEPNYQISVERFASHSPDLIVGVRSKFPDGVYKQLSVIAPVFSPVKANPDWQELLTDLAALTGTDPAPVLAKVESMCQAARAEIPQWQGKTYQWVFSTKEQLSFGNGSVLSCFGLKPAANQNNLNDGSGVTLENLDQLNADFLGIFDFENLKDKIEKDPRFANLPAKANGSVSYLDLTTTHALNAPDGPASFGHLIEKLLPILKATKPS